MRKKERGIALLLALLVLTILIVLIAQMSVTTLNTKTISENYLNDLQNSYGNRSGYYQALLYLEADMEKEPNIDSLAEKWTTAISFSLGKSAIAVTIEDSERRINLSRINNDDEDKTLNEDIAEQFRQLLFVLGHPSDISDRIIDYIDTDTKGDYENEARNDRLHTLEELLQIEGVPSESLYGGRLAGTEVEGFLDYVTIYPRTLEEGETAGLININTASSAVFQSLSEDITPELAAEIDAYRNAMGADNTPQVFEKKEDIQNVSGMSSEIYEEISSHIDVKATHFEIRVKSSHRNLTKNWLYVVKKKQEGEGEEATHELTLVFSQKLTDFLAVPPPEEEEN